MDPPGARLPWPRGRKDLERGQVGFRCKNEVGSFREIGGPETP
jgi:hypothetical protein